MITEIALARSHQVRLRVALLSLLWATLAPAPIQAQTWLAVQDDSLLIEAGSVLDFSGSAPSRPIEDGDRIVITRQGKLGVASESPRPRRFLMASTGFASFNGGYPDHAAADLYASQLRMHGYNMARLDFQDATLMEGRGADFDFDPQQLDRLFYLLSALRRAGIYYVLTGLTSPDGGLGTVAKRSSSHGSLKAAVHFRADAQEHWKALVRGMFAAINPYTHTSTLDDPALAGIILVNEGGLQFLLATGSGAELAAPFNAWLLHKYGATAHLAAAWGGELGTAENPEAGSVVLPDVSAPPGKRIADFQRFAVESEMHTAAWMTAYLRSLGYRGLTTAYNNWLSPAAHASRQHLDWIDFHNYFSEPTAGAHRGSVLDQGSIFDNDLRYLRDIASARRLNRPFTVSEYGHVFWDRHRYESALAVPAYASLQDWDAICQHTGPIEPRYSAGWQGHARSNGIAPFGVGLDPIARAGETLAFLLFLRGDMNPARYRVAFFAGDRFTFEQGYMLSALPAWMTRLALVTAIGHGSTAEPAAMHIDLQERQANVPGLPASILGSGDDAAFASVLAALRNNGLLDAGNRTDAAARRYQADTGHIFFDRQSRTLIVNTPRTEAALVEPERSYKIGSVRVTASDTPALLAVSSMDGKRLSESGRLLAIFATDARNSAMAFADPAQTRLEERGRLPVLLRAGRTGVALKTAYWQTLRVYSIRLNGHRGDEIPVRRSVGEIAFVLDTYKLSHGPTTFFEIASPSGVF